jgi:Asp-tRNA(Asn)/Glu-tRNA(Gln) amidotransferase A subunit family amidase
VYDLKSVKLPRVGGVGLRLLAALAEHPLTRGLILPQLLANGGVTAMRRMRVEEAMTFLPLRAAEQPARDYAPPDLSLIPAQASPPGPPLGDASIAAQRGGAGQGAFRFWRVRDFCEAYGSGRTTPEEVARRVLEAIEASERLTPAMRCFIAASREDVLRQARESTERWKAGRALGPLDGAPIAVKDEIDMLPHPTTLGTRFSRRMPEADATVVARLRRAGALLIGKTNMHEIGIMPSGINPHHGAARNPYNPAHESGGSSSGSGAAVAAGLCPAALGADGGGSIRIPAAFCGVVGLKPTFGRIAGTGANVMGSTIGHLGPIAATAEDAALVYAAIAGPDPDDPSSIHQPDVRVDGLDQGDLAGVRLGIFREWFTHAAPEVVRACEALVGGLAERGAALVEIEIPELFSAYVAHAVTALAEIGLFAEENIEHLSEFAYVSRLPLAMVRAMNPNDYLHAARIRTRVMRRFDEALRHCDVIVTPTTAVTAPRYPDRALPHGESNLSLVIEIMRFVNPGNLTGLPAISIPAGYDSAGLPVGLHLMGRHWEEALLLRIAYAAAPLVAVRRPEVWFDVLGSG